MSYAAEPVPLTEEEKCDRLVRSMAGEVVTFSVAHRADVHHVGIPDRRYRVRGVCLWAEIKSEKDRLTAAQLDFLNAEFRCGQIVFAGDADMLQRVLLCRPSDWRAKAHECLAIVVARTLR